MGAARSILVGLFVTASLAAAGRWILRRPSNPNPARPEHTAANSGAVQHPAPLEDSLEARSQVAASAADPTAPSPALDGQTYSVCVLDVAAHPLAGASVEYNAGGGELRTMQTDVDGRVQLRLRRWSASSEARLAVVSSAGHAPAAVALDATYLDSTLVHEVRLGPAGSARVVVLAQDRPAVGARVRLCAAIADLRTQAQAPARAANSSERSMLRDRVDGRWKPTIDLRGPREWAAVAGADGAAQISNLPLGVQLEVDVEFEGVVHDDLAHVAVARDAGSVEVEVRLGGVARLRGRVIDRSGFTVPGVDLWLSPADAKAHEPTTYFTKLEAVRASTSTDDSGRFEFAPLRAGSYFVGPALRSSSRAPVPWPSVGRAVELASGAELEVELVIDRDVFLQGVVVDHNGAPVAAAHVLATPEVGAGLLQVLTHADGTFSIGPVANEAFRVNASKEGCACVGDLARGVAGADFVVVTLLPTASLTVRALAPSGAPAPIEELMLIDHQTGYVHLEQGDPRERSSASIEGLRPGRYRVVVRAVDGSVACVDGLVLESGAVGGEPLDVVVRPAARVDIASTSAHHASQFEITDRGGVLVGLASVLPGARASLSLPPGEFKVTRASGGETEATQEIVVVAGQRVELGF